MALTDVTAPVLGQFTIRVRPATPGASPVEFTRFLQYHYCENYLSPSDEFWFEIAEKELSPTDAAALQAGSVVQVLVDGNVQSVGILDEPEATVDRGSGSLVRCSGRDQMSLAVDGQVDPHLRFKPSMTLADIVQDCYGPLGFTDFQIDNEANRNVITGQARGTPTSKRGKPLKSFVLHQEKPYPNEGVYQFTSRIAQRFGLWIRPGATAGQLIVAKPDFAQAPRYGLQHAYGADSLSNNVERGTFARSRKEQPSILYASGFGGGGEFAKSKLRAGIENPAVAADNSAIIAQYPDAPINVDALAPLPNSFAPFIEAKARPAFLYDSESHDQNQLNNFLLRELSLRMRKALTARYEIMGHLLNGQAPCVDTIANLNDQRPTVRWQGNLWVLGRRFSLTNKDGARTSLDLILPGSLSF